MDEPITLQKLRELMDSMKRPEFSFKELDEMIDLGADVKNLTLLTPLDEMKDIAFIHTNHGDLKVIYNLYVPPNTLYLFDVSLRTDPWKMPNYAPANSL